MTIYTSLADRNKGQGADDLAEHMSDGPDALADQTTIKKPV